MDKDAVLTNLPDATCRMVRDEAALITAVDDSIIAFPGWRPEQQIGTPSTALIHPNDQAGAVNA